MKDLNNTIESLTNISKSLTEQKKEMIISAINNGWAIIDKDSPFADTDNPLYCDLIWIKDSSFKDGIEALNKQIAIIDKAESIIRDLYIAQIMDLSFCTPLDQTGD
jgi:hypothetical protein